MRALKGLIVAPLGIAAAAVLVTPAAVASASTRTPAPRPAVNAVVSLKSAGPVRTGAVNPECKLFYLTQDGKPGGVAHISSFLKKRSVKINAQVQCRRVSMSVIVRVTLWKTGAIFPHKQAGPTMAGPATTNSLKNQKTFVECKNLTNSTFYGTAFASATFQGETYTGSLQSAKKTLACGT